MAEAEPLFMLSLPGNCSWVSGSCLKNRGFLQHQCWQRPSDTFLTLTVLVTPVMLVQGQKQEDPHHSPISKITLHPTIHQLMWHLSGERDKTPSPFSAHPNYAEPRKRWLHGQLQVLNSQGTATTASVWDGHLGSLNTTSVQWGQF